MRTTFALIAPLCAATAAYGAQPTKAVVAPADMATLTSMFRSIYASFAPGSDGRWVDRSNEAKFFSPSTLTLIQTARRLSGGGVDLPGYDVACLCQDYDAISFVRASYRPTGTAGLINATVTVNFTISGSTQPTDYHFIMQRTSPGWRIHDVTLMEGKSYRAELIASSRQNGTAAR